MTLIGDMCDEVGSAAGVTASTFLVEILDSIAGSLLRALVDSSYGEKVVTSPKSRQESTWDI